MTCSAADRRRAPGAGLARLALAALLAGALAAAAPAGAKIRYHDPIDLTNVFLGPELSRWLVGPIAQMASEEEIEEYLAQTDDAAAEELIERFWQRRDPEPEYPGNRLRRRFEERAEEADKLYRESGHPGRRTDRGTIHVLFGPPEEVDYTVVTRGPLERTVEIWQYPKDAEEGLHGERPARTYNFSREGDLTVFYRRPVRRPR